MLNYARQVITSSKKAYFYKYIAARVAQEGRNKRGIQSGELERLPAYTT